MDPTSRVCFHLFEESSVDPHARLSGMRCRKQLVAPVAIVFLAILATPARRAGFAVTAAAAERAQTTLPARATTAGASVPGAFRSLREVQ